MPSTGSLLLAGWVLMTWVLSLIDWMLMVGVPSNHVLNAFAISLMQSYLLELSGRKDDRWRKIRWQFTNYKVWYRGWVGTVGTPYVSQYLHELYCCGLYWTLQVLRSAASSASSWGIGLQWQNENSFVGFGRSCDHNIVMQWVLFLD